MSDHELLEYGTKELLAFRADNAKRNRTLSLETDKQRIAKEIRMILYNQHARRLAAGLTPSQAAIACIMAAKAQKNNTN